MLSFAKTFLFEEKKILRLFGSEYLAYAKSTGLFLPKSMFKRDLKQAQESNPSTITSLWWLNNFLLIKLLIVYVAFIVVMYFVVDFLKITNLDFDKIKIWEIRFPNQV